VFDVVRQVAPTRVTVLIQGESGTGKELIAKAIHQLSPRARQPLVTVHCAALSPTLLESELFGHEKGAFTGAHERRLGRFERADGGTLFLDEIGEIDFSIQIKLLRVLGERSFERVGSSKTLTTDVRLIAATNKNLMDMVQAGTFREDLFFRLRVVEIWLPPLRERGNDIVLLAQSFLKEFAREHGKAVDEFSADAVEALLAYRWPGNVRELRSEIERAVVLCQHERIEKKDLSPILRGAVQIRTGAPAPVPGVAAEAGPTGEITVREAEKQLIMKALREAEGNRSLAAKKIGVSRRTLHRKLHTYHLEGF
jgi:two-component system, NtrC family, response regulator AtoC